MKKLLSLCVFGVLLFSSQATIFGQDADDCNNHFTGKDRAKVKNRSPKTSGYEIIKKTMTLKKWYSEMSFRDPLVPDKVSQTEAIPKLETTQVTVSGYLMGCKYEHTGQSPDQDIHCEIASSTNWKSPHLVVEIPAGKNFCQPRKEICDAWKADEQSNGDRHSDVQHIFTNPPKVTITGFVFIDYHHATKDMKTKHEFSVSNGGRGIHKEGDSSRVNVSGKFIL